jgi:hypothetical protein
MTKYAVSISIGSSHRDKTVEVTMLGEKVQLSRRGTDGDMKKAAQLYNELDGKVDALGVGGADLGFLVGDHWYPLYSVYKMIRGVKTTPVVDGSGLKVTLEERVRGVLDGTLAPRIKNKRAFLMTGADRWGLTQAFTGAGYECVMGDLMFGVGLNVPIRSIPSLLRLCNVLMPVLGRIPFQWLYPVGEAQEKRTPKWLDYFNWAEVIAGDCHYITRYMPERMDGKIVVTNTTVQKDVEQFRQAGVKTLVTTTPVYDGRSFGTNMMEAGLVAAMGRKQPVDYWHAQEYLKELRGALDTMQFQPAIQELN